MRAKLAVMVISFKKKKKLDNDSGDVKDNTRGEKIIKIHRGKEHNCRDLMELTTKVFTLGSRTTFCL